MVKAQQIRRMTVMAALLVLAFCGLGYRLVELQVLRHENLLPLAEAFTKREYLFAPRRGDIRDIRGNLLATSLPAKTVCADPSLIGNRAADVTRAIAPVLQLKEAELFDLLARRWRTNSAGQLMTNKFVVLQRKVPIETWQRVQRAMTNLTFGLEGKKLSQSEAKFYRELRQSAVFAAPVEDQLRIYPNHRLVAHVLGYVGMAESEFLEITGKDGIELAFNRQLSGVRGWRITEKTKGNQELVYLREQDVAPAHGLNVVLTLDLGVQYIVETELAEAAREHRPDNITCVAMRPRTGEIVAMATLPNFDPNQPGEGPEECRKNRVIMDQYEPGSTFKVVVVSGALYDNTVQLNEMFFCENGLFAYAGHPLHDHHRYGWLPVESIITKSSNIGAAKIGIKMGPQRLYEHIRNYGFGALTGVPLPGEVRGTVHPLKDWSKVSIAQIPMGHGLAVTRLQMAYCMGAIANQGVLMRPLLVDRLEDNASNVVVKYQPQPVRQVISPEAAALMVKALKTVVTKEGTAYKARLEHYSVAGKTGTAQKSENGHYVDDKFFSSFVGFFPADNPELCIAVVMDNPKNGHYGGDVCGPVFQRIAERAANYLNIRPDLDDDEQEDGKLAGHKSGTLVTAAERRPPAAN